MRAHTNRWHVLISPPLKWNRNGRDAAAVCCVPLFGSGAVALAPAKGFVAVAVRKDSEERGGAACLRKEEALTRGRKDQVKIGLGGGGEIAFLSVP